LQGLTDTAGSFHCDRAAVLRKVTRRYFRLMSFERSRPPEGATPRFDAVHSLVVEKKMPPMALCAGL